jgi:heat shock protein HslJ
MVTDSTITFADMQSTERTCPDLGSQSVAGVIDHPLSGTVDYEIRGDELILSGQGNGLLVYTPGR